MTDKELFKLALDALDWEDCNDDDGLEQAKRIAITALKERLLADPMREVQRLGQEIEQEPVAHLWECLGRWSAYLVDNGTQAECAPPSWLVDAVKNAITPPRRTWVDLSDEDIEECFIVTPDLYLKRHIAQRISAKLKEKNQ